METTTLREVDWITILDNGKLSWEGADYRTCDICDQSYQEDVCCDPPKPIRKFYFDDAEGLCVCEHCVEKYLAPNGE